MRPRDLCTSRGWQVDDFTALMSSKNDQLTTAKDALLAKAGENGARGASLAESNAEKSAGGP